MHSSFPRKRRSPSPVRAPRPSVTLAAEEGLGLRGGGRQRGQRLRTCLTRRRPLQPTSRSPRPGPPRLARARSPAGSRTCRTPGAGMGALLRALLLPLLAQWLLRAAPALAPAPFTLPLQVAAATSHRASAVPGLGTPELPRADGLALALEPAGATANFLAMVDNLQGDSGRGYYLEMLIGTPPQKVGAWGRGKVWGRWGGVIVSAPFSVASKAAAFPGKKKGLGLGLQGLGAEPRLARAAPGSAASAQAQLKGREQRFQNLLSLSNAVGPAAKGTRNALPPQERRFLPRSDASFQKERCVLLGGRLEEGAVRWRKSLELIPSLRAFSSLKRLSGGFQALFTS